MFGCKFGVEKITLRAQEQAPVISLFGHPEYLADSPVIVG